MSLRKISKVFLALEQAEGAGAIVRRSIGTAQLRNFSPFLLLDHLESSSLGGFPDHPHRGQETISYILSGSLSHEDFTGAKGHVSTGGLQFMTAGRGIMHSEIPNPSPSGAPNIGLQLWVDLPSHLKLCPPRYRDLPASEIPLVELDEGRVRVKVISGKVGGVERGRDLTYVGVWYLDFEVEAGGKIVQEVPKGWNAFAYLLTGQATFGSGEGKRVVKRWHNVVFEQDGDSIEVSVDADAKESAHFVLIAGQPLDQPVVRLGPFVMNTEEEVQQAMRDFRRFENGFERARGWESEIGRGAM